MIIGTFSADDVEARINKADNKLVVTPQMKILCLLKKAAEAGNALGRQGHGIKDVQIIVERDYSKMPDEVFTVRVIPDFKLRTAT